jgi:hypothetical protein
MPTLLKVQWHAEACSLDYILLKVRCHAEACAVMRIWLSAAQGYGGIPLRPAHAQHTASGSDLSRNGVKVISQSAINCAATTHCCPLLVQLKRQPAADWFPDSDGIDAPSDRPNAAPGSAPSRCLHGCPSMRSSGYDVESTASAPAPSPHQ